MFTKFFIVICFLLVADCVSAQTKWSLQACIDYALKNNISVKQADLQTRFSALTVSQNHSSRWPSLSFSSNSGYRFGLSENPTTGTLQSSNFFSSGFSLSAGVTLFNWFTKQHTVKASQLIAEADKMAVKKAENDVTLNVSAAYLGALLAKELVAISLLQVQQSVAQAEAVRKKISVGVLSNFDDAQIQLQVTTDSAALLSAQEAGEKSLLILKAVLNLDAAEPLDIEDLPLEKFVAESLLESAPEKLYDISSKNLPEIKQMAYSLEAATQTIKAAKAARNPTFSLYGSAGSNFVNIPSAQTFTYIPQQATGANVFVNGTSYEVMSPSYKAASYGVIPYFSQFRKNFGQNVGISVSVPLLNGKALTNNLKREELNLLRIKLQKDQLLQELKTTIYTSYTEAIGALNKVRLMEKLVTEATTVFDASQKRYNLNLLSTQDLLVSRNNLQRMKTDLLMAQYDLVFKIKLLEFYKVNSFDNYFKKK